MGFDHLAVRLAAFQKLATLVARHGRVLPSAVIAEGFEIGGRKLHFATRAKGIFRPAGMDGPALSITSTIPRRGRERRYDDIAYPGGSYSYRFQGGDPDSADNRLLRRAFEQGTPLIYFFGIAPGMYEPLWPVYLKAFSPETLVCEVVVGEDVRSDRPTVAADQGEVTNIRREYRTVESKRRLHQDAFRFHVLRAYRDRCAICLLPQRPLLEAAHIVPDRDEQGVAEVPNGLSLCHLHHGAFDAQLMGIAPSGVIRLAPALLASQDGPTLEHGLKSFEGKQIHPPIRQIDRPREDLLTLRFAEFRRAAGL